MTDLFLNPLKTAKPKDVLPADAPSDPLAMLAVCPVYEATPLLRLPGLAEKLGVGRVLVKDESRRMRLNSFKALGGVYAVFSVLRDRAEEALGRAQKPEDLIGEDVRAIASALHFVCASDGNHGRAVAAGARIAGARASVYLHKGVSEERAGHIARLGAEIVRTEGTYDDSVEQARRDARANNWILISDTADTNDMKDDPSPLRVMQGYTVIAEEIKAQLAPEETPTHLFLQAGVGGLAAAMASRFTSPAGHGAPRITVVEPESADCLFESAKAGMAAEVAHSKATIYAMLECLKPSLPAWEILSERADAFLTIADTLAARAVHALAYPCGNDTAIRAGASGAAGLAGAMNVMDEADMAAQLQLDETSTLLLIVTEGVTDEAEFARLTRA